MADKSMDFHLTLSSFHARLLKLLCSRTGLDRSSLVRLAIYRLAVEERVIDEVRPER